MSEDLKRMLPYDESATGRRAGIPPAAAPPLLSIIEQIESSNPGGNILINCPQCLGRFKTKAGNTNKRDLHLYENAHQGHSRGRAFLVTIDGRKWDPAYRTNLTKKERQEKPGSKGIYASAWSSYTQLGFAVFPASRKDKQPLVRWRKDEDGDPLPPPTQDDYQLWESKFPDANIFLQLDDHFAVIEGDGPGAEEFIKSFNLPKTPVVISGGRSIHRYFKTPVALKPLKVKAPMDGTYIEIRTGEGMGMTAPPSIHPETGKPYRWTDGLSPWEIPFAELPEEAYKAIEALMPKREPLKMDRPHTDPNLGSLDVERYLGKYGIELFEIKPEVDRTLFCLRDCLFKTDHSTPSNPGESCIIQGADGTLAYFCFHSHCADKTWQDARRAISGDEKIFQFCQGYVEPSKEQDVTPKPRNQPKEKVPGKKPHNFSLRTSLEVIEMSEPKGKWLWDGFIPRAGSALFLSKPKVAKTTAVTNLAVRAARGETFLGRKMEKCRTVLLGLEMKESDIKPILLDLRAGREDNLLIHCGRAPGNAMKEIRPLLEETKANLLVIDMVQKFMRTKDVKDYSELTNALEQVVGTAQEFDCATVMTHHLGKTDKEDADDAIGSTAFVGGVDTIFCIKTLDPGLPLKARRRYLYTIQRYGDDLGKTLLNKLPDGSLELGSPLAEVELSETMNEILSAMQSETKYKQAEIFSHVSREKGLVISAMKELQQRELIKKEGKGVRSSPYLYEKVSK